jgi:hypothetical protein
MTTLTFILELLGRIQPPPWLDHGIEFVEYAWWVTERQFWRTAVWWKLFDPWNP